MRCILHDLLEVHLYMQGQSVHAVLQSTISRQKSGRAIGTYVHSQTVLYPFCFLSACPHSVSVALCSVLASYVLLVGASVADAAEPAGEHVFATGLVRSFLRPLSLQPSSRVARRCPPSFRPFAGAESEAPLG
jgi:hypothetical protein